MEASGSVLKTGRSRLASRSRFSLLRSCAGFSLVELMIATLIMSFVSAATFGLLTVVVQDSAKVQNKLDNVFAAQNALEKMTKIVRMGVALGDTTGNMATNIIVGSSNYGNSQLQSQSASFPSSKNPVYGAGESPPSGWPVWADNSQPCGLNAYVLDNQTLIVQRPVFDANGFPCEIPAGQGNPAVQNPPMVCCNNCITDIFKVVPDQAHAGEYVLQWAELPGWDPNGLYPYAPSQVGPETICTGIIGPLDANNLPRVFQYVNNSTGAGQAEDSISNPGALNYYSCVIVNLEILNQGGMTGNPPGGRPCTLAFKTEIFLRENAQATTAGQ